MQLFHIDADKVGIKWNNIEISSVPELLFQLRKVLRIKKWDKICIQYLDNKQTIRHELSVQDRTDKDLTGEIVFSQTFSFPEKNISMLVAMPNKREKAELIAQKLTEIWVQNIYFRVSEHSIIRQRNDKKSERLDKISHEALEQSRWIQIPEIKFLKSESELQEFIRWKSIILANMNGLPYWDIKKLSNNGIFTGIMLNPVLPFITDKEEDIKLLVKLAHESGAKFIHTYMGMTLRENQRDYYFDKLDIHFKGLKEKYIKCYRERYDCIVPNYKRLYEVFTNECNKYGILYNMKDIIKAYKKEIKDSEQMSLF